MFCGINIKVFVILLSAFIISLSGLANAQANIGFENGNLDNWEFAIGKISVDGHITTYPSIAVPGDFTLIKNEGFVLKDSFGQFSLFSPNGSKYCLRLGNSLYGNTVQQISYTLTVPNAGSNSIIFDYAVVLEDPGHQPKQQPRFTVKIYNITDNKYIDCSTFDFISSTNLPGFKLIQDTIFYKDWSSATINLKGLNNKKIRLEFTVNHCSFGAHFGYAYIDVNENSGDLIQGYNYCRGQDGVTLTAPSGFETYTWFSADLKTRLGSGQRLILKPPRPDLTRAAVLVTPYNGLGCIDTLYTTLHRVNEEFNFIAKESIIACPGSTVDLTQPIITSGSSTNLSYEYFDDSFQILHSPTQIERSGTYYIRASNAGGCNNTLPVNIRFGLPQLKVINPPDVTFPATVDLSTTFRPEGDVSYSYYVDEGAKKPLINFSTVSNSGIYYIKATSISGCTIIQPVKVTILPPPSFTISAPNTFTPNNDGINDLFPFALDGFVSFNRLQIFNRDGTQVFKTNDIMDYWDGKHNGKPVAVGTYYWVFEGYDSYYHRKVYRSASITLIR